MHVKLLAETSLYSSTTASGAAAGLGESGVTASCPPQPASTAVGRPPAPHPLCPQPRLRGRFVAVRTPQPQGGSPSQPSPPAARRAAPGGPREAQTEGWAAAPMPEAAGTGRQAAEGGGAGRREGKLLRPTGLGEFCTAQDRVRWAATCGFCARLRGFISLMNHQRWKATATSRAPWRAQPGVSVPLSSSRLG